MRRTLYTCIGMMLIVLGGCNIDAPAPIESPTPEQQIIATPPPRPSPVSTAIPASPLPTATELPRLEIATSTATDRPVPASPKAIPTATSPVFEYVVQPNDSMFYVIQLPQHGYSYERQVAATVVALNDNIINMDFLPVGETILIPRPTTTATAVGASATQAVLATIGVDDSSGARLISGVLVGCYEVEAGDSLVDIALRYNTTLEVLSNLNREIDWFGCAFTEPSGGPDCNPNIQIGQCIDVPQPTPLPSKTPTLTGNETATPTATHRAPRLLFPTNNALIPPGQLLIQWVAVGGMSEADEYLIEIVDQTTNTPLRQASQANAFLVPPEFVPTDGQAHFMQWRVSVARRDEQGVYHYVGGLGEWRAFQWMSS